MIITIDGPSGTGKSTVAKKLADTLGWIYFDTGAMFRTLAYGVIKYEIDLNSEPQLGYFLAHFPVTLKKQNGVTHFFLDDEDATMHLRRPDVTEMASKISTIQAVRQTLAIAQRKLAISGGSSIFDGRDMGTVIFPHADLKIFLTADPQIRAERRYLELVAKNPDPTLTEERVLADILERDTRDMTRDIAPLKPAEDAHVIDTSALSIDEVVAAIKKHIPGP
jgi:cytidylate kinase